MSKHLVIPKMLFGVCFLYLITQTNQYSPSNNLRSNLLYAEDQIQGSSKRYFGPNIRKHPESITDDVISNPSLTVSDPSTSTKISLVQATDVNEGNEFEPTIIYRSTSSGTDLCHQRNQKPVLLCRLGHESHCQRVQISEQLSSWWMICPIYSANVSQTGILYQLHANFRDYAKSYGINFQTVETVFPGQEFLLTKPNNQPYDLQYHADWIFAMRENLVNVGAKHLPDDWQYLSWIDQHIYWTDPYWFEKSIWLFEHNNIVQLLNGNDFWDLNNKTSWSMEGFASLYTKYGQNFETYNQRQCGLAWGVRREIFEEVGGLFDLCIGTKCDLYQNYAYVGLRYTYQTNSQEYINMIAAWQDNAIKVYDKKIGYLDSKVIHFVHCIDGCKTSDYDLQINAMNRNSYTPSHDLTRDEEGRLILTGNLPLAQELWTIYGGSPR